MRKSLMMTAIRNLFLVFRYSISEVILIFRFSIFNFNIRTVIAYHSIGQKPTLAFGLLQDIMFPVSKFTLNVEF